MSRAFLFILFLGITIPATLFAQESSDRLLEEYMEKGFRYADDYDGNFGATNNPDDDADGSVSGFTTTPVKWISYKTNYRPCRALVN
jgi:hypothetical protein